MKVTVLLFAFFATECYCDHESGSPDNAAECGENEFWVDAIDTYCKECPSKGCDSIAVNDGFTSSDKASCESVCEESEDGVDFKKVWTVIWVILGKL